MKAIELLNRVKTNKALETYLFLVTGMTLFLFSNGKWTIPIFTWIAPFFLIRAFRGFKGWVGLSVFFILLVILHSIRLKGIIPASGILYYIIMFGGCLFLVLPYLFDRWFAKRITGFQLTLIFPLTSVIAEYVLAVSNGFAGSWCSLAHTQDNVIFLQLASITGIWGLTFVIAWLGSIGNWLVDKKHEIAYVKKGIAFYMIVIVSIFLFGEIRTGFFSSDAKTVRIASITHDKTLDKSTKFTKDISLLPEFRNQTALIHTELLNLCSVAANQGAKIIFLHEASLMVLKDDEKALIAKGCELAKDKKVYLGLSLFTLTKEFPRVKGEAKIVWIDPMGKQIWEFNKAYPTPSDPIDAGDKKIKTFDTPYGRIASVICFDMDFPSFINEAGKMNVDIMLVPANDWKEITPLHANMSKLRAIENGFSLVRCTGRGLSVATDNHGNVISQLDYYKTKENIMISDVPIKGIKTIYGTTGDIFFWMCLMGLLFILGEYWYKTKREKTGTI